MTTYLSSREFNQEMSRAKRVAEDGVVYITDRGTPTHVLMSIKDYRKLTGRKMSMLELLYMPDREDIDLPLPADELAQAIDLD